MPDPGPTGNQETVRLGFSIKPRMNAHGRESKHLEEAHSIHVDSRLEIQYRVAMRPNVGMGKMSRFPKRILMDFPTQWDMVFPL